MPVGPTKPGPTAADVVIAGLVAAAVSGVPSTMYALWRGRDVLEGALAAGTLLLPHERRRDRLLVAAAVTHVTLSLGWAAVLARSLPERATVAWAMPAGLAIAGLDLGVVGRRFDRIRALPQPPQVADHVAYAITVGAVLQRRRSSRLSRS
jgi:hypothetical protein